jgi:hypothetical protein
MLGNRLAKTCLASMVIFCSAGAILAQGRPLSGSVAIKLAPEAIRINLLAEPEVQEDLHLDKEQKATAEVIVEQLRAFAKSPITPEERQSSQPLGLLMRKRLDAFVEKVDSLLDEQQSERLDQITLQARGPKALRDDDLATELKLTDNQRQQLREAFDEATAKQQKLSIGQEDFGDRLVEIQKELAEKNIAVLTDEQRARYEHMQGKKIELPGGAGLNFSGGRRRRR